LQNQEDCSFTVVALLPTLGSQLLEAMDVEKVTHQLREMSGKAARGDSPSPSSNESSVHITTTTTEVMAVAPPEDGNVSDSVSAAPPSSSGEVPNGDAPHKSEEADSAQVDSSSLPTVDISIVVDDTTTVNCFKGFSLMGSIELIVRM
jgi:peroxin-3